MPDSYEYSSNNPVNLIDPSGRIAPIILGITVFGIVLFTPEPEDAAIGVAMVVLPEFLLLRTGLTLRTGAICSNTTKTATELSVEDKLARYLLNPNHPVGGTKAKFFEEALGFTKDNADDLARQFVFDPKKATQTTITEYGTKYNQIINVVGANGRTIPINTAWIKGDNGVVRLVTAVPGN